MKINKTGSTKASTRAVSEKNRKRLFEVEVNSLEAMEYPDESLGIEFDEQLTPNHIDTVERLTDWVNNANPKNTAANEAMSSAEQPKLGRSC